MADLTLRDLPDDLHEFLKALAATNHRSLDQQVIAALQEYRALKRPQAIVRKTPDDKRAAAKPILDTIRKKMTPHSHHASLG